MSIISCSILVVTSCSVPHDKFGGLCAAIRQLATRILNPSHVDRMATQHGRLREFHPETESIKAYLERVALYFTANEVAADKRVAVLLSSIGAATYSLLSDLVAPHLPSIKSLEEISEALRNHYEPQRVVIAERFHFHKRDQAAGEQFPIMTRTS